MTIKMVSSLVEEDNCDWYISVLSDQTKIEDNEWRMVADQSAPKCRPFAKVFSWKCRLFHKSFFHCHRSVVNFASQKHVEVLQYKEYHQNIRFFLVFSSSMAQFDEAFVTSHICGRIDSVHFSLLYLWKVPIWLNGPILDSASCRVVPCRGWGIYYAHWGVYYAHSIYWCPGAHGWPLG